MALMSVVAFAQATLRNCNADLPSSSRAVCGELLAIV